MTGAPAPGPLDSHPTPLLRKTALTSPWPWRPRLGHTGVPGLSLIALAQVSGPRWEGQAEGRVPFIRLGDSEQRSWPAAAPGPSHSKARIPGADLWGRRMGPRIWGAAPC